MIIFYFYFLVLYSIDNLFCYKYYWVFFMEELKFEFLFIGSYFVDYFIFIGGNIDIEIKI